MKTPTATSTPQPQAAKTKNQAHACQLEIPHGTFRRLEETASRQGFKSLPDLILHVVSAYAWPADRVTITGEVSDFKRWNQAARAQRETLDEWLIQTLNEAAEHQLSAIAENPAAVPA
jgi:hypothetical protein